MLEAICAQAERYPAFEPVELDTKALDDRDAALAHALYDGADVDAARVCDLCARFLADYPALKGVSEDAEVMLEELQCDGGLVERHRSLALHEIAAARGRPRAA